MNLSNVLFLILCLMGAALLYSSFNPKQFAFSDIGPPPLEVPTPSEIKEYHKRINNAISRLRVTRDCQQVDLSAPSRKLHGDPTCAIFHPDGANVEYLYFYQNCSSSDHLKTLAIGDSCGAIVYAGDHMGKRLYTTMFDLPSQSWNHGDKLWSYTQSTTDHDGKENTNFLINIEDDGAPYKAAHSCRNLGTEWYLPSSAELQILYENRHAIGNFTIDGVFPDGIYWSSTESNASNAYHFNFRNGFESTGLKLFHFSIRCVRR